MYYNICILSLTVIFRQGQVYKTFLLKPLPPSVDINVLTCT